MKTSTHKTIIAAALLFAAGAVSAAGASGEKCNIKGTVTLDGVPAVGVTVCDGRIFAVTDKDGHYSMQSDKLDSTVFVITPSGTVALSEDGLQPGFWKPLCGDVGKVERADFALKSEKQERYGVVFIPDLHLGRVPGRDEERKYREIALPKIGEWVSEMSAEGPVYAMALGDMTQDKFWYSCSFNGIDGYNLMKDAGFPAPIYAISGNHDNDGAVYTGAENTDRDAAWMYRRTWGPDKYSVNIGGDHWIFMDDTYYINDIGGDLKAQVAHNYECRFTLRQLQWLEEDLGRVDKDTQIFLCTHIPFYNSILKKLKISREQMDHIYALLQPFSKDAVCFAAHIHRTDFLVRDEYPRLKVYNLAAASGGMWVSFPGQPFFAEDGADAGAYCASFGGGVPWSGWYNSYTRGRKCCRVYDANTMAAYCAADPHIPSLKYAYTNFDAYEDPALKDCVIVNYWTWQRGHKVEILEDGVSLKVEKRDLHDPLMMLTYEGSRVDPNGKKMKKREKGYMGALGKGFHMFIAKASGPDTPVTVRISDENGNLIHEETVIRPKSFSLEMD